MKTKLWKRISLGILSAALLLSVTACGGKENGGTETSSSAEGGAYFDKGTSSEEIIKRAAAEGKVGNWGLGNEYEVQALLAKYDLPITYLAQDFSMDGFDDDSDGKQEAYDDNTNPEILSRRSSGEL